MGPNNTVYDDTNEEKFMKATEGFALLCSLIPNAERLLSIYFRCDFTYNATFDIDTMYLLQDKRKNPRAF